MKRVSCGREALKALRRMPTNTARRIKEKIDAYAADPQALANNVTALKGHDAIRLRVGDWRVILIDETVIEVVRIAPRGNAYDRKGSP